jgi:hypothetical protein
LGSIGFLGFELNTIRTDIFPGVPHSPPAPAYAGRLPPSRCALWRDKSARRDGEAVPIPNAAVPPPDYLKTDIHLESGGFWLDAGAVVRQDREVSFDVAYE